jgi:hypothetical protein
VPDPSPTKKATDPLRRIESDLAREFPQVDRGTVTAVATSALDRYKGAKIKDFTPILAWRDAREGLRQQLADASLPEPTALRAGVL